MERLVRTRVGNFVRERAYTLEQVENLVREGRLSECLLPVDGVFAELPAFSVLPEGDAAAHNGNPLDAELLVPEQAERKSQSAEAARRREKDSRKAPMRAGWHGQSSSVCMIQTGRFVGLYDGPAAPPAR